MRRFAANPASPRPRGTGAAGGRYRRPEVPADDSAPADPPVPPAGPLTAAPVSGGERVGELDLLRGAALLGICVVNLPYFAAGLDGTDPANDWDRAARAAVLAFGGGKFFPLFAFLYGYGIAVQGRRADDRGGRFGPRYARRLSGLFAVGLAHAVLLFFGDILTLYALLGVGFWFARRWPPRRLAWVGAGLLGLTSAAVLAFAAAVLFAGELDLAAPVGPETVETETGAAGAELSADDPTAAGYGGSFLDGVRQRLRDLPTALLLVALFNGPVSAAAGLLGMAAGSVGLIERHDRFRPSLMRWAPLAAGLGLTEAAALATAAAFPDRCPTWAAVAATAALPIAGPALSACYALALIELHRRDRFQRTTAALRAAGRMSLTVYLGQSLLAGWVFGGWGLGWFGTVGDAGCLLLAPIVFAVSAAFAVLWLRAFRFGPAEWLLRCWTYQRRVGLRK